MSCSPLSLRAALVAGAAFVAGCGSSAPTAPPASTSEQAPAAVAPASGTSTVAQASRESSKKPEASLPAQRRPDDSGLVIAGASRKDTQRASRRLTALNTRCLTLPAPGSVGSVSVEQAAQHARLAAQLVGAARLPGVVGDRVSGFAGRLTRLSELYVKTGSKPSQREIDLVQRSEAFAQANASSLGLSACGPLGS